MRNSTALLPRCPAAPLKRPAAPLPRCPASQLHIPALERRAIDAVEYLVQRQMLFQDRDLGFPCDGSLEVRPLRAIGSRESVLPTHGTSGRDIDRDPVKLLPHIERVNARCSFAAA